MNKTIVAPASLVEAIRYFADKDVALTFLASLRWPDGVTCPHCAAKDPMFLKTRRIWKCRACRKQFSVKVGTIFEDSPISLGKWLPALWLLANAKNGVSSYELARSLGVTQKTGWFMLHRIRLAMQSKSFEKFRGEVEVDETYIGGRARFMHKDRRERLGRHKTGAGGKAAVVGLLARHSKGGSKVRLEHVRTNPSVRTLMPIVKANVEPASTVYTDAHTGYNRLVAQYRHKVIDHAEAYAVGSIHTNGLENFWSLLKRSIKGTYVSIEPFHLFRYLDEQAFRFNNRKTKDVARFVDVVRQIIGKRLTYRKLIGADLAPATT